MGKKGGKKPKTKEERACATATQRRVRSLVSASKCTSACSRMRDWCKQKSVRVVYIEVCAK